MRSSKPRAPRKGISSSGPSLSSAALAAAATSLPPAGSAGEALVRVGISRRGELTIELQAADEIGEMKLASGRKMEEGWGMGRIEMLEGEVAAAKESEMAMLQSLAYQTKQLEQAKIELEEAKLEIRNLHESIRDLECSSSASSSSSRSEHGLLGRFLDRPRSLDSSRTHSHEDVHRLRSELRAAMEAEEKSKKAMDDLAVTLKEVMTEMCRLKEELSVAQSELAAARAEAGRAESIRKAAEDRLLLVSGEAARLRLEADESAAAWNAKEDGFVNCMKMSEAEMAKLLKENAKLAEARRLAREESSKLRDIMKQALNEATIVKEALEIARGENSQLKDLVGEKDAELTRLRGEYERLRVRKAAAAFVDGVDESKPLLAAAPATEEEGPEATGAAKLGSEQWTSEEEEDDDDEDRRRVVPTGPGASPPPFRGSMSERMAAPPVRADRTHKPLSCVSDLASAPSLHGLDAGDVGYEEYDHMGRTHLEVMSQNDRSGLPPKQRKKRQILRRFGDLLRRGSVSK